MNAVTFQPPPWGHAADLDELLADEVTIAVMRADNVTPLEVRRLFGTLRAAAPARPPITPARR